jgi:DNA-directed RNA polymerase specialized sigma24 family protein
MAYKSMDLPDPDAALMVAFQNGDTVAFDQLLGKYHRAIVNFIYKIVNDAAEAEDLAQDDFFRIYRARSNYEPRAPFAARISAICSQPNSRKNWRRFPNVCASS